MFQITSKGSFRNTLDFINRLRRGDIFSDLDRYGRIGVDALARATPVDSGLTAGSWQYRIISDDRGSGIEWYNTNAVNGTSIAILLQYGHGTGTGGYVSGRDYINPATRPIFDQISEEVWKKVNS